MKHKNYLCVVIALSLMMHLYPATASGPTIVFTCENGTFTRIVEAQFSVGGSAPCQVIYKKIDEEPGITQKLWSSRFSNKYCLEKLDAFIEKQRGWGWRCHATQLGTPEQDRD